LPTRIIREGILTSEPINSLSERAEIFYRRLMSVADDFGRYFAHPSLLRAACFPLLLDRYSEADVKQMLSECEARDVLTVYGAGKYLQVHKFRQQTRSASKFPEPTEADLLSKCKADAKPMCSLVGVGGVSGAVSGAGVEGAVESGVPPQTSVGKEPNENAVTLPPRPPEPEPADARQLIPSANRIMARFNEVRGITYTSPAEINVCVELLATGATEAQLVEAMEYARKRYWKSDIKGDRQKFAPSFVFSGKVFPGLLAEAKKRRQS